MMVSVSTLLLGSDTQGVNHEKADMRYGPRVYRNSSGVVWAKSPWRSQGTVYSGVLLEH